MFVRVFVQARDPALAWGQRAAQLLGCRLPGPAFGQMARPPRARQSEARSKDKDKTEPRCSDSRRVGDRRGEDQLSSHGPREHLLCRAPAPDEKYLKTKMAHGRLSFLCGAKPMLVPGLPRRPHPVSPTRTLAFCGVVSDPRASPPPLDPQAFRVLGPS